MTITDILADLEAKAKLANDAGQLGPRRVLRLTEARANHIAACSPDRILALVAYVRKLEQLRGECQSLTNAWTKNRQGKGLRLITDFVPPRMGVLIAVLENTLNALDRPLAVPLDAGEGNG